MGRSFHLLFRCRRRERAGHSNLLVASAVILVAAIAVPAAATAALPFMVSQQDAAGMLERVWDHATCVGIPRLGVRGVAPKREFAFFDCRTLGESGLVCYSREKAVKGVIPGQKANRSKHGLFHLEITKDRGCT